MLEKINELTDTSLNEALGWLKTINALQFVNPRNGEVVVFEEKGDVIVNVQQAVTRLKALRVDIENDSGDIYSSEVATGMLGDIEEPILKKGDVVVIDSDYIYDLHDINNWKKISGYRGEKYAQLARKKFDEIHGTGTFDTLVSEERRKRVKEAKREDSNDSYFGFLEDFEDDSER